jgi:salicylate hydroxylase
MSMRIAIVGGGIAGLGFAIALGRAGLPYRIYEQAAEIREVGAGIQVAPNATRLLHRFGLAERLDAVAVRPQLIERRRWQDGTILNRSPLGDECVKLYGAPYYTVHRGDLQRAMLELVAKTDIQLGAKCVAVEEQGDEVELRFADGSAETADVVVGADGIHSAVRASMIPDQPRFMGRTVYRGLVPAERLPHLCKQQKLTMWMGPQLHCIYYPVAAGSLLNFSASTPADDWRSESWLAEGNLDDLVRAYQGWHGEVLRVVTSADRVNRWALFERDAYWGRGRVILIGDAAHAALPFLAQGANQAIEDAVILTACLRDMDRTQVPEALQRYQRFRHGRVTQLQEGARQQGKTLHLPDGDEQRQRDDGMHNTHHLRQAEWLFGYDAELATAGK